MASAATVVVGAAATKIVAGSGQRVLVRNSNTTATELLIVGFSNGVTAANGFGIAPGSTQDLGVLLAGEAVWGIRVTADVNAQVLQVAP